MKENSSIRKSLENSVLNLKFNGTQMKKLILIPLFTLLVNSHSQTMVWKTTDGRSTTMKAVSTNGETVKFQKKGVEYIIPIKALSLSSQSNVFNIVTFEHPVKDKPIQGRLPSRFRGEVVVDTFNPEKETSRLWGRIQSKFSHEILGERATNLRRELLEAGHNKYRLKTIDKLISETNPYKLK